MRNIFRNRPHEVARFREEFSSISSTVIIVFSPSVIPNQWTVAHI